MSKNDIILAEDLVSVFNKVIYSSDIYLFNFLRKVFISFQGRIHGEKQIFRVDSRVEQTSEEGRRPYRPKRCEYNNKDEDNCLKTMNDKNYE